MAKRNIKDVSIEQAKAIQLLAIYNPALTFMGFAYTATATPVHSVNKAWIAAETATIFGLACAKGQIIVDNGNDFFVESMTVNSQNSWMIQNITGWQYLTISPNLLFFSKVVRSFAIVISSDFRKADGSIRKIKIRVAIWNSSTDQLTVQIDTENFADSNYTTTSSTVNNSNYISISFSCGIISLEIDRRALPYDINTPTTYANGGLSETIIKNAQIAFETYLQKQIFNAMFAAGQYALNVYPQSNGYLGTNGAFNGSVNWRTTTNFINVTAGEVFNYIGSTTLSSGAAICVAGYDLAGTFVGTLIGTGNYSSGVSFNIPSGVSKIKACTHYLTPIVLKKYGVTSPTVDTGKTWAAIGHSIWWQDGKTYSGGAIANGIQTLVQNEVSFTAYDNYGYSGYRLAMPSAGVFTNSILGQTDGWISHDIWTLDCITNDFKLNTPIGSLADFTNRTGGTTFYGALRELHEIIKALNPNYAMICANALKRNNSGYTSWSINSAGHTLADYSVAMEAVANRLSWRFINQFRDSFISDENLSFYTIDGLHLNDFGYSIISGLWISEFKKI